MKMKTNSEITPEKKASAWGKIEPVPVSYSLEDVMSEQLVEHLQQTEIKDAFGSKNTPILSTAEVVQTVDCESENEHLKNDFLLAQLLQLEMDKEYDELLKEHENFKNRNSHIAISYDKFKSVHPIIDKEEKEINRLNEPEVETSEDSEDELPKLVFKNGVCGKGENMISKHDLTLNARHNAAKVMNFPPEYDTGDSHGMVNGMRLSNKVFNELKTHQIHEKKYLSRVNDKQDKSTNEIALDAKTKLILFKLVNADIIDSLGGVISTGKEAVIIYATGGKTQDLLVPKECVAKVFKTTLNEFKTREKYIANDYRFKDRYKHLNPQKIVRLWAEKEMHNLMKMKKNGIRCPDVVMLKKHILIMSFIGIDNKPAFKLKDADLNQEQLKSAYEQCIQLVKDLYHKCNLVHADLNQFNLLWHENQVWCVDVSQSVEPVHPMGFEFLLRDCANIFKFFTNRKLENVMTPEELFNEVTGNNFKGEGELFLSQIQRFYKDKKKELHAITKTEDEKDEKPYSFDYHFEKSLKANNEQDEETDSD